MTEEKAYKLRIVVDYWMIGKSEKEGKIKLLNEIEKGDAIGIEMIDCIAVRDVDEIVADMLRSE